MEDTEYLNISRTLSAVHERISPFETVLSCPKINSLPPRLKVLHCEDNELCELPDLPESLQELHCDVNFIERLPELPLKLKVLSCSGNNIETLPPLSHLTSLVQLNCGYNRLTSLPELPPNLKLLICGHNFLRSLPILPQSLTGLYMSRQHSFTGPYASIDRNMYVGKELEDLKQKILQIKAQEIAGLQGVYTQGRFASLPEDTIDIIARGLTNMSQYTSLANRNLNIREAAGQPTRRVPHPRPMPVNVAVPLPPIETVEEVGPEVTGATCTGAGCFRLPRFFTRRRATVTPALRRNRRTQRNRKGRTQRKRNRKEKEIS